MTPTLLALLATTLMSSGHGSGGECNLSASTGTSGLQASYDPFRPRDAVADLEVVATNVGEKPCNARFYVAPLGGQLRLDGPADELDYRIEGPNGGSGANERGPFTLHVPPGGSRSLSIRFVVPAQQVVGRGRYTSQLGVRGLSQSNEPVEIAGANPIFTVDVGAQLEMSISGTASPPFSAHDMAPASMHFPNAQAGQRDRVFVNVWANSGVSIALTSENRGLLRHMDDPALTPIRYSATFDGAAVNLGGRFVAVRMPPLSLQGASYELAVTLGDTSGRFAGTYRDVITVEVTAN